MEHFFKPKPALKATHFVLLCIVFLITSCCKDPDCKCGNEATPEYREYFIAHAGGEIGGINYTNCLEAMNLSYSKGCRLFELDLRLTTDNVFVASHDPIEMSEAKFMSQLIEGKYTPMNMKSIVQWFTNHPDAILVTDKINTVRLIYNVFPFHNRLIMELFTWAAVDSAIALGITPMASENLVFGNSKKALEMGIMPTTPKSNVEVEQIFEEKKIKYINMNRKKLMGNEDFLRRLKKKNIKNYVFNIEEPINGQPAEEYVWNYEMNFCYGMYANNLDLLKSLLDEN